MATLLCSFTFCCASRVCAISILSVLEVNGNHCFDEYFAVMGRGKAVTGKEKEVIIK